MIRATVRTLCILILTAVLVFAADASFSGTWKLNVAKSQLSGTTYSFSKTAAGAFHFDDGAGFAYDFDVKGKDVVMPSGMNISVTAPSADAWEFAFKINGKVTEKGRATVKGDSISWVTDITGPDGKTTQQMATDTRVSGGPGFLGKWKSGDVKGGATTLQIALDGTNGITFKAIEYQTSVKGSFDGKDYVVMDAGQPSKFSDVFEKTGSNTFKMTGKLNGKPYTVDVFTISADGKTLTDETTLATNNEKTKSIYDRQ